MSNSSISRPIPGSCLASRQASHCATEPIPNRVRSDGISRNTARGERETESTQANTSAFLALHIRGGSSYSAAGTLVCSCVTSIVKIAGSLTFSLPRYRESFVARTSSRWPVGQQIGRSAVEVSLNTSSRIVLRSHREVSPDPILLAVRGSIIHVSRR